MLRNIIGPLFNFKNCVFFVVFFWRVFQKSSSFCRENEICEKNINPKKQKNGPLFNFEKGKNRTTF